MSKHIEKVRVGDMIDVGGKKLVTDVHPYIVRLLDLSTGMTSTACVGYLVIAGVENQGPSTSRPPRAKYAN